MTTAVSISPVFNAVQFFDNDGTPLNGGKIFSYVAGSTSTQQITYTTAFGDVANSNPIVLDSAGRCATGIWLIDGAEYNLVLTKPDGTTVLESHDNIIGVVASVPSGGLSNAIWTVTPEVPVNVSPTRFYISGADYTDQYAVGNRARYEFSDGSFGYGTVSAVTYDGTKTTVTLITDLDSPVLSNDVTAVYWSAATVTGRIIDAGAISYTPGLVYTDPTTVGGQVYINTTSITDIRETVQSGNQFYLTGGSGTAYTLTPTPAISSYITDAVWNVIFHTANIGVPTMNISGLGGLFVYQYDHTGALVVPVIVAGMLTTVIYDDDNGVFIVLNQLPAAPPVATARPVVTYVNIGIPENGTWTVPADCFAAHIYCTTAGLGSQGFLIGASLFTAGGTLITTLSLQGTDFNNGPDGGSGMVDSALIYVPIHPLTGYIQIVRLAGTSTYFSATIQAYTQFI